METSDSKADVPRRKRGRPPKKPLGPVYRVYAVRRSGPLEIEIIEARMPEAELTKWEDGRKKTLSGHAPFYVGDKIEGLLRGGEKW